MSDNVNHPAHYTQGGVECIDAIEAAVSGLSGIEAVCTGNAIKYLWRWKRNNGIEDLKKAKPPKRNALAALPQYHFDHDDFCNVMFKVFTTEEYIDIDAECSGNTHLDKFTLMRVEDEFYILHRDSGTLINWYKHAGRTNTCNKPDFTLDDFRDFLVELRKDLVWNGIIKDEELKKKMQGEWYA